MKRFVVYSGPSCVGKGPLRTALEYYYPEFRSAKEGCKVGRPILYVSRAPRKERGEREGHPYRFTTVEEIEAMVRADPLRYISGWIRGKEQIQALDLHETNEILQTKELVLLEFFYTLGMRVLDPEHSQYFPSGIQPVPVFISPLSAVEIAGLKRRHKDSQTEIYNIMIGKLDRRGSEDAAKNHVRASWAYREMQNAHRYAHVIVNHDGEDSSNWGIPPEDDEPWHPITGDAKRTLDIFVEILRTGTSHRTEHWQPDTL